MNKTLSIDEILSIHQHHIFHKFVTNLREVEHLGVKLTLCEDLNKSTRVYNELDYVHIGTIDLEWNTYNKDLYMHKDKDYRKREKIAGNTIHQDPYKGTWEME